MFYDLFKRQTSGVNISAIPPIFSPSPLLHDRVPPMEATIPLLAEIRMGTLIVDKSLNPDCRQISNKPNVKSHGTLDKNRIETFNNK